MRENACGVCLCVFVCVCVCVCVCVYLRVYLRVGCLGAVLECRYVYVYSTLYFAFI